MTRINKLSMKGFKSFAKFTEFLFGPKFNVILGPNGSGKSNVLDALCFVLGKTSAKSLRAEKSANLIYDGGKSKKAANSGEVNIYFDNQDKTFPTEEKEVKITRIIRQNGQSIYKINDKLRTRQQIVDLLNIAKINPDSYNIILQGDIVRFCEMHPIQRRELIDDISGISIYEEKKHKALLELGKVDQKLNDAELVLKERKTYLKELKQDRDQALKFKDMNDKIKMYKASLLKLQIDKTEGDKKEIEKRLEEGKAALEKINKDIEELKKHNEEKKKEIEALAREIEEKGEVEQVNLNKEIEAMKIDLTRKNSRRDTIKIEFERIQKRRADLRESIKETDSKIANLMSQKLEMEKELKKKNKEKDDIEKKVKAFKEKNQLDDMANIDKKIEDIDKRADELQKNINSLREQQHSGIRDRDAIQHQINTIDEQIQKVKEIEKEHQKEIDDLKKKRDEFKKVTLELNKRLNEDSSLASQLGASKEKLAGIQEKLAELRAREIGIKEVSSGDISTKEILKQKNKIRGIYGTVAELGHVDSKYALALEVAAGPRMKSIVVDDDKVAADCIKFLKQKKLGTATFLPINKLKVHAADPSIEKLSKSRGSYGLALDLVEFEPKFRKVFEYVFANTVIVENIDAARRLGIGSAKFTTLDGDKAELSGVMEGGFRKRKGLGFKEKELDKDISGYEKTAGELENTIEVLEKRRKENEEEITKLRETKAALDGEIIKTEKSLHLAPTDLEVSKQKKEELQKQIEGIDKKIDELVNKISNVNKELAYLKIEKQKLRSKISELRDPALIAEISTFEEKYRQLNETVVNLNAEMKNIDAQITTLHEPEKIKTNDILKQLDKDEEGFNDELKKLNDAIKNGQKILEEKEEQAKVFYAKFKGLFKKQSEINGEIQKNEITISKKQALSREAEIKNNTLSIKSAEIIASLEGLSQEFRQYEGVQLDTAKNEQQLKYEISKFEKLKEEIGYVNMRALEVYDEIEKAYNELLEKKENLTKEREDVSRLIDEIEGKKKELFMQTFNVINTNFKTIFGLLSTKGEAYLELENEENPFEGGLTIKVKISSMKFLDIRSLSGGEKTMTALAFIFSIQEYEPASFYVLDEVDAALDKRNSEKLAKLIAKYSDKAQYVMISHNDGMISEADNLYGISMNEDGISKVVSLKI
jgi:chromosome segregation protein